MLTIVLFCYNINIYNIYILVVTNNLTLYCCYIMLTGCCNFWEFLKTIFLLAWSAWILNMTEDGDRRHTEKEENQEYDAGRLTHAISSLRLKYSGRRRKQENFESSEILRAKWSLLGE